MDILLLVFPAAMILAVFSDLFTMKISNRLTVGLAVLFFGAAMAAGLPWDTMLMHLAAGALVLAVCFALFALNLIGGGDAKLAAATALWLGFGMLMEYFLLAALGGGALALVILMLRRHPLPAFARDWAWLDRLHDQRNGVPYGVALGGAALFVFPQSAVWLAAAGA